MSDQQQKANKQGGDRLFENMDEQERLYAPEQVPGATQPAHEVDEGGTAASNAAATSSDQAVPARGVLPVAGSTAPFPVPVRVSETPGEDAHPDGATANRRPE